MHIKQKIVLIALAVFIILSLCGCGEKTKSESEILEDISEYDEFIFEYGVEIASSNITKRQTNEDEKTDYVFVELNGSTETFDYSAEYELMYELYNDGWMLENIEKTTYSYTASHPEDVLQSDADAIIESMEYDEWEFESREESENLIVFHYETSENIHYLMTSYLVDISYSFTPQLLWEYEVKEKTIKEVPDILGEWSYSDDNYSFYVNVINFDLEAETIDLEYNLQYNINTKNPAINKSQGIECYRFLGPYEPLVADKGSEAYNRKIWRVKPFDNDSTFLEVCTGNDALQFARNNEYGAGVAVEGGWYGDWLLKHK